MSTTVNLCGELRVELDGRRVEDRLHGRQGRMLLAYLVLHRDRPVRRDELLEALWPDEPPAAGDSALGPPLSRLRAALGAERLTGRAELRLELGPDAEIDVEIARSALERARRRNRRRRGARITITGATPGKVAVKVKRRGKLVARGSGQAGADGTAALTARFTKAAKRKLRSARRVKLTVLAAGASTKLALRR